MRCNALGTLTVDPLRLMRRICLSTALLTALTACKGAGTSEPEAACAESVKVRRVELKDSARVLFR
jgi:hypothetical protein